MRTKEREDYLKTIYVLQRQRTPVRTTDIARTLGIEPASVTGVIKRLADLDLVQYEPYKGVTLSAEGMKVALEIIRNHRLIELYLVEALGYTWDEVHEEAERLEHAVSDRFIERIEAALGYPTTDPHGAPIPDKHGTMTGQEDRQLGMMEQGEGGRITRVMDEDPELLRYLDGMGIRPGEELEVVDVGPYGGAITLLINGERHSLGRDAAEQVYVRTTPTDQ